ncbi:hypothetical protein LMG10733_1344 [Bifidobacterium adolescentis]|nr:hypothetical protein LMG10733_1344 [Bifidobacterium adolescentis]SPU23414.1 Uncharacterised protein [Bifidobacterium adolescentis]
MTCTGTEAKSLSKTAISDDHPSTLGKTSVEKVSEPLTKSVN